MAYQSSASGTAISVASAPVSAYPFTFAAAIKNNNNAINVVAYGSVNPADDQYIGFGCNGTLPNDPMQGYIALPVFSHVTTGTFSTTDWNYGAFSGSTAGVRSVYLNGASPATASGSTTWPADQTIVAMLFISGASTTGQLAELGLWDVALTAAEVASLSKGFKPYRIRPQNLVFYAPLVRNLSDLAGAVSLTNNSATVAAHPRVI